MLRTSSFVAALALTTLASAQNTVDLQICYTDSIPMMTTGWNDELTVPRFDPLLGELKSVEFRLSTNLTGQANFESLDMAPAIVTTDFSATVTVFRPGGMSPILNNNPTQSFVDNVAAFDGTIDFGGTSGVTYPSISVVDVDVLVSPPPPTDLALFTGMPGNPGTITLPVEAVGTSAGSGAGNLIQQFMQSASASLEVCYNYCVGIPKCTGDGGNQMGCSDCPCSNNAPMGTVGGCLNSVASSARILADGVPSVANDTLRFNATGAIPNNLGILFSGSNGLPQNAANPCFGLNSGVQNAAVLDGLRCVGGTVRRHPARMSDANGDFGFTTAPWGPPGGPPQGLIARGGWMAGQTTCWQVYYRDNAAMVCGSGANSTNALEILIQP